MNTVLVRSGRVAAGLVAAVLVATAVLFASPVLAKDVCRDQGLPSFKCPTTATRAVCGRAPNLYCFNDGGNANADICRQDRYKFDCVSCSCKCDTATYPCADCGSPTSKIGQACNGVGAGTFVDRCGTCGCGAGTALCATTNTCVTVADCPAGSGFEPCAAACVPGYVPPTPPAASAPTEPEPVIPVGQPAWQPPAEPTEPPTESAAPETNTNAAAATVATPATESASETGTNEPSQSAPAAQDWGQIAAVALLTLVAGALVGFMFGRRQTRLAEHGVPFHGIIEKVAADRLYATVGHGPNRKRVLIRLRPEAEIRALTLPEVGEGALESHEIPFSLLRPHDTIEVIAADRDSDGQGITAKSVAVMTTDVTLEQRRSKH